MKLLQKVIGRGPASRAIQSTAIPEISSVALKLHPNTVRFITAKDPGDASYVVAHLK